MCIVDVAEGFIQRYSPEMFAQLSTEHVDKLPLQYVSAEQWIAYGRDNFVKLRNNAIVCYTILIKVLATLL